MFKSVIWLALSALSSAQWAFTVPDGDLGEKAPGNNVRQGDIHDVKWRVGLSNEPVKALDDNGHASLWITSGLDESFNKLLSGDLDSTNGGTWAWDTATLSDDDIDKSQGVFIYRIARPVSSSAATFDWDTNLTVSSVSFRLFKKSETTTTQARSSTTVESGSSTSQSTEGVTTTTSAPIEASTTSASITTDTGSSAITGGLSSPTTSGSSQSTTTPGPSADSGISTGAKAGIGIGAVGAIALVVIAALLWRRQTRKSGGGNNFTNGFGTEGQVGKPGLIPVTEHQNIGGGWTGYPQQQQLSNTRRVPAELMSEPRHEMPDK